MSADTPDDAARRTAVAVAYRMLGTVAESEDIAQEALLRMHEARRRGERIESPRAFVATIATRLAINHLRSARVRREAYVGQWLPEPVITDADPADLAETADSLSMAFLVLLETLTPEQRAALLLHDVFDYGYDEVARIIGTTAANARQLASRARRRVGEGAPRFQASRARAAELADRFFAAAQAGDLASLEVLLAHDVELRGDGGGNAPALARPVRGRARVARSLVAWARAGLGRAAVTLRRAEVNGQPGAVVLGPDGAVIGVLALEVDGGEIRSVSSVVNPEKLAHLGPTGDIRQLLARSD